MYIRDDLLNKIKKVFNVKEFTYAKTGKYCYNNNDLFIFDCGNETIAIEAGTANFFSIYKTKENFDHPVYFYAVTPKNFLLIKDTKTRFRVDGDTPPFPGNAFACTSELVLLAMENS